MKWCWLCPEPNDPEVEVTLDGQRTLILVAVIRKLWVDIVVARITKAWERHNDLSPANGTDMALLHFFNALEHATETGAALCAWNIRRALDSVAWDAMELGWTRLGVPTATAHWLDFMDEVSPTVIRSGQPHSRGDGVCIQPPQFGQLLRYRPLYPLHRL